MSIDTTSNIIRLRSSLVVPGSAAKDVERLASNFNYDMPSLNEALSVVNGTSRPSLVGISKDLFAAKEREVRAAICEFIAFGWLMKRSLITEKQIGYPFRFPSRNPPFEGVLHSNGIELAFDVKDGVPSRTRLVVSSRVRFVDS